MITSDFSVLDSLRCDVCVVGSGPVGTSLAVELESRGLTVAILESGLKRPDQKIQALSDAVIKSLDNHFPTDLAASRSLGGTSRLWGGRCVQLDEIDFEKRDYIPNSGWPIDHRDFAPYWHR